MATIITTRPSKIDPALASLLNCYASTSERLDHCGNMEDDDYDDLVASRLHDRLAELEREIWEWFTPTQRRAAIDFTQAEWEALIMPQQS